MGPRRLADSGRGDIVHRSRRCGGSGGRAEDLLIPQGKSSQLVASRPRMGGLPDGSSRRPEQRGRGTSPAFVFWELPDATRRASGLPQSRGRDGLCPIKHGGPTAGNTSGFPVYSSIEAQPQRPLSILLAPEGDPQQSRARVRSHDGRQLAHEHLNAAELCLDHAS